MPTRSKLSPSKRGYGADWQKLRNRFLALNPTCQCDECLALPPMQRDIAEVVDHKVSFEGKLDSPLRLDWNNLRSMSKLHHDRRTGRDQGNFASQKASGVDENGYPTDPRHPWRKGQVSSP